MKLQFSKATALKSMLAAGGTLLAASIVVGTERNTNPVVQPQSRAASSATYSKKAEVNPQGRDDLNLVALNRPTVSEIEDNLFAARVPAVPSAPPPPPAASRSVAGPPPKPVAPALPFKFLGRLLDGGVTTVFLAQSGKNLAVNEGDVVNNMYRVEQVRDGDIVFTYLPMQERQVLRIGGRN